MNEIIKLEGRTYYVDCPSKIGIYLFENNDVCLIDSGSSVDFGKKVASAMDERGWRVSMIINTHAHADHVGANAFFQKKYGAKIYASETEKSFIENTIINPSFIYGGRPHNALKNKFLYAEKSVVEPLGQLPKGFERTDLPGHAYQMTGIKTPDGVWFLGDALSRREILEKYRVSFLYDVEGFLKTLEDICDLQGKYFVCSHVEPLTDLRELAARNREAVLEVIAALLELCAQPTSFETIMKRVFEHFEMRMNENQYVLVANTLRSYMSYLIDEGKICTEFDDNVLYYRRS